MEEGVEICDLVVGVDFGTAYTGVAHCFVGTPGRIEVIDEWPGVGRSNERVKVPTEISYQDRSQSRWGYDIPQGHDRYGWFKLHLDPGACQRAYNDAAFTETISQMSQGSSTSRSLAPGKTASDMTTDYLKLVYRHTMDMLEKTSFKPCLDNVRIKFVITCPAIWSPAAQDETRRAAQQAGFGSRPIDMIEMVSEPEAAANYTLKTFDDNLQSAPGSSSSNLAGAAGWEVSYARSKFWQSMCRDSLTRELGWESNHGV
ncbi:hypothetical protein N0V84_009734 [Fusarium piperis]|uniref:Uncharacterized protein n=1 Tax=Fusarium piperis TaxID=1435070 RepID=A0A9W9BHP6_9HYPO|nr:hypothetical protein N0V84_009734 [Fusarium piperis]